MTGSNLCVQKPRQPVRCARMKPLKSLAKAKEFAYRAATRAGMVPGTKLWLWVDKAGAAVRAYRFTLQHGRVICNTSSGKRC